MKHECTNYNTQYNLRCSKAELAIWHAMANEKGVSLAKYIRECLRTGRNLQVTNTDPILIRQISAIGNNLNQLMRWLNSHNSMQDIKPIEKEVQIIRSKIAELAQGGKANVG